MGLDMYLEAEHYVGGGWDFARKKMNDDAKAFDALLDMFGTNFNDFHAKYPEGHYAKVSFQVAYWRKANAIHKWFVDNVQGGKDECQRSYVPRKALEARAGYPMRETTA